jgi:hypothetical protein
MGGLPVAWRPAGEGAGQPPVPRLVVVRHDLVGEDVEPERQEDHDHRDGRAQPQQRRTRRGQPLPPHVDDQRQDHAERDQHRRVVREVDEVLDRPAQHPEPDGQQHAPPDVAAEAAAGAFQPRRVAVPRIRHGGDDEDEDADAANQQVARRVEREVDDGAAGQGDTEVQRDV